MSLDMRERFHCSDFAFDEPCALEFLLAIPSYLTQSSTPTFFSCAPCTFPVESSFCGLF